MHIVIADMNADTGAAMFGWLCMLQGYFNDEFTKQKLDLKEGEQTHNKQLWHRFG
jgi:hypothetical protein